MNYDYSIKEEDEQEQVRFYRVIPDKDTNRIKEELEYWTLDSDTQESQPTNEDSKK
jgi:hypothetical protein